MSDVSRAQIAVKTDDATRVLEAIDQDLRRWGMRRQGPSSELTPASVSGHRGPDVREAMLATRAGWTWLVVEDLPSLFTMAWPIHKATSLPVIAARAFRYGSWQLKVYAGGDLIIKVGDDPDHELAWVGRPLDSESIPAATAALGGGEPMTRFCRGVVAGRPEPHLLGDAIGASQYFETDFGQARSLPGFSYVAWARPASGH